MGGCKCSVDIPPTQWNYGGTLRWIWSEGNTYSVFRGPSRWCNPYNCSNTGCYKKGCAEARALFCREHGEYCPTLNRKICSSEKCPGRSTCEPVQLTAIARGKLWCGDPRLVTGGTGGAKPPVNAPPSGPDTRNCSQGNVLACFSEMGNAAGNFFKDAAKTGGEQTPLLLMLGAGVLLVLLLKR